jgi:negative modulator of initiation of replication
MNTVRPLAIETDVFDYIINKIADSGESASTFLRYSLGISTPKVISPAPRSATSSSSEIDALLDSAEFRNAKGVVGRFLILLGWLYNKHRDDFDKVETIKGRGRLYFAKSARALHDAGKSVNPKQIPNSPYWVITTSPTDLKQQMIRAAMFAFGYAMPDILRAEAAIAGSARQQILNSL